MFGQRKWVSYQVRPACPTLQQAKVEVPVTLQHPLRWHYFPPVYLSTFRFGFRPPAAKAGALSARNFWIDACNE